MSSFDANFSFYGTTDYYNALTKKNDPINAPKFKMNASVGWESRIGGIALKYRHVDRFEWSDGIWRGFIGPYDLSASLGIAGKFNNPKFKKNIKEILKKAKNKNISCGIHIVNPDSHLLKQHLKNGFKFIAYGMDTTFLREGSKIFKLKLYQLYLPE